MFKHRNMQVLASMEPWMQENILNKFRSPDHQIWPPVLDIWKYEFDEWMNESFMTKSLPDNNYVPAKLLGAKSVNVLITTNYIFFIIIFVIITVRQLYLG